jgi:hypothetical protein
MTQEQHGHSRPAAAPDHPLRPDQAADMSAPPDEVPITARPVPQEQLDDEEEYEPVDTDEEAVVDELRGGPETYVDDPYPHESTGGAEEGDLG